MIYGHRDAWCTGRVGLLAAAGSPHCRVRAHYFGPDYGFPSYETLPVLGSHSHDREIFNAPNLRSRSDRVAGEYQSVYRKD